MSEVTRKSEVTPFDGTVSYRISARSLIFFYCLEDGRNSGVRAFIKDVSAHNVPFHSYSVPLRAKFLTVWEFFIIMHTQWII